MAISIKTLTHILDTRLFDALLVNRHRAMPTSSLHAQWPPLGKPGKADVSAFESMPVRPKLDRLISLARQSDRTA